MTRQTWGVAALVVAVVFMVIGVSAGLSGNHETALPAVVVSILSLLLGATLIKD